MVNETNIDNLILRTKRYPFLDGLPDLAMAALFLVTGVGGWLLWDFNLGGVPVVAAVLAISVVAAFGMRPVTNAIRARWLWQKTGWVEPSALGVPRWVYAITLAVWFGTGLLARWLSDMRLVDDYFVMHTVIVSSGWGVAAFLIAGGVHLKLRRYIIAGIIGLLAVTPLLFSRFTFGQSTLVNGLVWGVILSITGAIALNAALRKSHD